MPTDEPTSQSGCSPRSNTTTWIERTRRMVEYHPEVVAFIHRASETFPVSLSHRQLLLRLWVEADYLDELVLPHLSELNDELLEGRGVLDTTRGVSTRQAGYRLFDDSDTEEIVYECAWTLEFESGVGVSVVLSVAETGVFEAVARGNFSGQEHRVGYPVSARALQDAISSVYVSEATST